MWCCLFSLLFFMCVCVWFAHSGHSLSVSVWTLIDSCSHAPWGQLTCSYMHLSFSLSAHPFLIFLFHSLPPSLRHMSFSCQTVIDMFLYLQQSALHFHHKTHMLKHFYNILKVPLGKFAIMIKNSQKGLVKLKQANYIKISIKIKSKFIDQIQNVAEVTRA